MNRSRTYRIVRILVVFASIAVVMVVIDMVAMYRVKWGREPVANGPNVVERRRPGDRDTPAVTDPAAQSSASMSVQAPMSPAKRIMIEEHLKGRDIKDPRVLNAMATVPREEFVEESQKHLAYADQPLPIGHGQTISQPYIVALMTQLAQPGPDAKALDVGTGSGYQAAVLAELCREVYSIEIVEPLADDAKERLERLGYENVTVRAGDGYRGWPEHAPFDVIILAAAPDHVPEPLVEQLAPGGRLVLPVGDMFQELVIIEKQPDGSTTRQTIPGVAFVPMTGEAQK